MNGIYVLIPSLNPDERLVNYVRECILSGFEKILLIDDGSDSSYQGIFQELREFPQVEVLVHPVNRGKGAALKTGFSYAMKQDDCIGIVTADSDGQHQVADVIKVAEALLSNRDSLILGCRVFDGEDVPWKSSFGNKTTSKVFKLLYGRYISDTQTGLRGIGRDYFEGLLSLKGERYEYETQMLIFLTRRQVEFIEIPIETIYEDGNAGTHFRPVVDSMKIYGVMLGTFLRFLLSSLSSSIVDLSVFALFSKLLLSGIALGSNVLFSTIIARVISSIYNFTCNKKLVFKSQEGLVITAVKYFALVIVQMLCSAGLVYLFTSLFGGGQVLVKMVVDTCLFFVSYQIQHKLIFKSDL